MPGEASLDADNRVDWDLGRTAFIVCPFSFRRLPIDAELVERLARDARKAFRTMKHRFAAQARSRRSAINAVTQTHELAIGDQRTKGAQHLILATERLELAREKGVFILLAGNPLFDFLAYRQFAGHCWPPPANTRRPI